MTQVALVTGGARRIGRAICLHLADAGYDVAIHVGTSQPEGEALAEEIRALGRNAMCVSADLSDMGAVDALVPHVQSRLGHVRLLVNNASVFERDGIDTLDPDLWHRHMQINLFAPLRLVQGVVAALPAAMTGAVVNILDQRIFKLTPDFLSYTLSKAALHTATITLAQALAPYIRVNAIAPGPTLPSPRQSATHFQQQVDGLLLKRPSSIEEIAQAVVFLAQAETLTGQTLAIDSGQSIGWQTPDTLGICE